MTRIAATLLLFVIAAWGCGLKGDLYIPEPVESEPLIQDAEAEEATGETED